MYSPN